MSLSLTDDQVRRYARQVILKEVGGRGQRRLLDARALIVGAGGLGSPAALYLAAAGVGTIGIADPDVVDATNLSRQILHGAADAGRPKLDSARDAIARIDPAVRVQAHPLRVRADNARALVEGYHVAIEGSDDPEAKFAVSDAAVAAGRPAVIGAVVRWSGQVLSVLPGRTACYRCLFEEPPPPGLLATCEQAGVIGPACGVVGSLMAVEAIKLLLGLRPDTAGGLIVYDALAGEVRRLQPARREGCRACGSDP